MKPFLFVLFFSVRVFAQDTEFFHQPSAAGVSEITPHAGYRTSTIRYAQGNSSEVNFNGLDRLGVSYSYGVSHDLAFGLDLAWSKFKFAAGGQQFGFEPLKLFFLGRHELGLGQLNYGLRVQFGLEKPTSTDPSTRSYGDPLSDYPAAGLQVVPSLGWALAAGPGVAGLRAEYAVVKSDTVLSSSLGDIHLKDGAHANASAFYEILAGDCTLGAALTYDWFNRVTSDNAGQSTTTVLDAHSMIGARLYALMPYAGWQFLPAVAWREKASGDTFDKTSDVDFDIAGRIRF